MEHVEVMLEVWDGEEFAHVAVKKTEHDVDPRQGSGQVCRQLASDVTLDASGSLRRPLVMHVHVHDATNLNPPVPAYPSLQQSASHHAPRMLDPVRGVPNSIRIGTSASSQSLGYYGNERALTYDVPRHSYTSEDSLRSAYPPSYEPPPSGYNHHYHPGDIDRRKSDPVRRLPRSKSYEPTPQNCIARNRGGEPITRHPDHRDNRGELGGLGKPDHVRGVPRSKSYEPSPSHPHHVYSTRRGSRRPDTNRPSLHPPDPVRQVSRSKSYEPVPYNHVHSNYANERSYLASDARNGHHRPSEPTRGVPRSISYEANPNDPLARGNEMSARRPQNNASDQTELRRHVPRSISLQSSNSNDRHSLQRKGSNHHEQSLAHSHHSSDDGYRYERGRDNFVYGHPRQSELSASMHSLTSVETPPSCEELTKDKNTTKRGSKKDSSRNEPKSKVEKAEDKEESVKDGEMDAYRAMANASERTRKKKLNATSYVKVTLGNGMTGYVKSIKQ